MIIIFEKYKVKNIITDFIPKMYIIFQILKINKTNTIL